MARRLQHERGIGLQIGMALSVGDISLWNGDAALAIASCYGTADGGAITIRTADAVPSRPMLLGDDGIALIAQHPKSLLAGAPIVWRGMVCTVAAAAW